LFGAGRVAQAYEGSYGLIASHELALTDAATGYDKFDRRVDGFTKVLLRPAA
jgi:glutathione-independent formaldehyde dehydrogenase